MGGFRKKIQAIVLINVFIVAMGVLFIELTLGNWIGAPRLNGLNIRKSVKHSFSVNHLYETDKTTITYERDENGLRGKYQDPNKIDIMTVGGSTTDQKYLAEENTWTGRLRKEFEQAGKNLTVVNAGIDGQSSYGHIKNFDWWFPQIPDLSVKYYLFFIGLNDIYKDAGYRFDELVGESNLRTLIRDKSALYSFFRTLRGIYLAKFVNKLTYQRIDFKKLKLTDTPLQKDYARFMRPRMEAYKNRLIKLSGKVRAVGATPVFATQASRNYKPVDGRIFGVARTENYDGKQINGADRYYMEKILNGVTAEVADQVGAVLIDVGNDLVLQDEDYYDIYHTNPEGSKKIGHFIFSKLNPVLSG